MPKAIACGYYEGAGFACSNGTPLAPSPRSSPWRRIHLSDGVRGPSLGVCSGVPGAAPSTVVSNKQQRPSAHCDVGAAATPRWRRLGVSVAQRPCTRLCPHSSSARHVPPLSATAEARCDGVERLPTTPLDGAGTVGAQVTWAQGLCHTGVGRPQAICRGQSERAATASGAGRRLLPTPSASAPPARATAAAALWLQPQRARGKMALLWRTRDGTRTAARLRRRLLA